MSVIYERLGVRVRLERSRLGWTQEELAEKAAVHPGYIGQIERSQKKISLAMLERIAAALSVRPGILIDADIPVLKPDWESRIGGLLRDKKPPEQEILYSTLRQLSRSMRKSKKRR